MSQSKVFMFDGGDPEIHGAHEKARDTFRYFWREVAWERRRIVPGLDMAAVKAPFSDEVPNDEGNPNVEHMWLSDVDFNGREVSGTLLNAPNWLKSVNAGDVASVPLEQISDWMYVIAGEVYGAHTVNLMRSRMSPKERKDHDAAWGLEFGDPHLIRLVPDEYEKPRGLIKGLFGKKVGPKVIGEHPMSENSADSFREQLTQHPEMLEDLDDNGWTLLHHQALAGSAATVSVLLELGADVNAVTTNGTTPLQLAQSLKWDKVVVMLEARGAR
ncbi:DUF2314 domain-containing protein [Humisphaera borealis]|uniref:DUF2314 domain-containing protein n=1 Tax=Humisphaera borealis TaxID=2807512 RepID=A0A7M2WVD7_9BACT|nr:DUF2314 domain-containing protein [Humisphaera borealis]QOV89517.1 DUF2314 domain-containing protein [Humisphaera borealis]